MSKKYATEIFQYIGHQLSIIYRVENFVYENNSKISWDEKRDRIAKKHSVT